MPPVSDQALETSLRLLGALMGNRACDWLDQARRDWEHTRHDAAEGYYEWACFSAQQAAEKALKALHFRVMRLDEPREGR